jgi:hypothetical protein
MSWSSEQELQGYKQLLLRDVLAPLSLLTMFAPHQRMKFDQWVRHLLI